MIRPPSAPILSHKPAPTGVPMAGFFPGGRSA
jgi:hypothetical protein